MDEEAAIDERTALLSADYAVRDARDSPLNGNGLRAVPGDAATPDGLGGGAYYWRGSSYDRDGSDGCMSAGSVPVSPSSTSEGKTHHEHHRHSSMSAMPEAKGAVGGSGWRAWLEGSLSWRTVKYARPDYKYFAPAMLLLFVEAAAAMFIPKYVEEMVDIASGTLKYKERDAQENEIRNLLSVLLLIVFGQSTAMFLKTLFFRFGGARLVQRLRGAIHRSILRDHAFEFIDRFSANELVSYLGQVDAMETMLNDRAEMLQNVVFVLMGVGFFFWTNADLGPILMATVAFLVFITFPYNAVVRWNTARLMRREAELADYAQSSILRIRQVRNLATEDIETRNFAKLCREIYLVDRLSAKVAAAYDFLISMSAGTGFAVAMWLASRDVIDRDLSRGKLLAFFMYADIVFENLQMLFEKMEAYSASTSAARLLFDLIGTKFTADDDVAAKTAARKLQRESSSRASTQPAQGQLHPRPSASQLRRQSMQNSSINRNAQLESVVGGGDDNDTSEREARDKESAGGAVARAGSAHAHAHAYAHAHAEGASGVLLRFVGVDCRHPTKWGKGGIRSFSMDVACGDIVYVYGPADLGISCILDLACGFYTPDRGTVRLFSGDVEAAPSSPAVRRAKQHDQPASNPGGDESLSLAWLSADDDIFPGSVFENIAANSEGNPTMQAVHAAAAEAGVHDAIIRLPHGYDTRVTSHFRAASGDAAPGLRGARKHPRNLRPIVLPGHVARRIAVARAFLRRPQLVLADAAFLTCDQEDAEGLFSAVVRLLGRNRRIASAGGSGVGVAVRASAGLLVVGEHIDENITACANRIIVFGFGGHVCEEGTHEALMARTGETAVYARMLARRKAQGRWLDYSEH